MPTMSAGGVGRRPGRHGDHCEGGGRGGGGGLGVAGLSPGREEKAMV